MEKITKLTYFKKVIRPSFSLWILYKNMMHPDSKKVKWRIVIDYRELNKQKTVGVNYYLPDMAKILDNVGKPENFTAVDLDLTSGFCECHLY